MLDAGAWLHGCACISVLWVLGLWTFEGVDIVCWASQGYGLSAGVELESVADM